MPRGSPNNNKRKADNMGDDFSFFGKRSKSGVTKTTNSRSKLPDEVPFNQKKCMTWFREYVSADDPETMGPEGMEKFCEDIGVEPENVVMLVLAWKMGAKQMGFFTQQEWLKGLSEMQADSIQKLQGRLDHLKALLSEPSYFKAIYLYSYDFARDKDQRSMDIDTAKIMLQLLLAPRWTLFPSFQQFLEQSRYKVINKDQWSNILEFSRAVAPDLSNYDMDGAWPVLLDEFVDWMKNGKKSA